MDYYLHARIVFHYTLLYNISVPNISQGDVLRNLRQPIWISSLVPVTPQNVSSMWSIPVGTFSALSLDEGNRYSFVALNAYSQHYLVSVSNGCSLAIYCTGCTCHLKPTVLQDQMPLDHVQQGRYLYTCCRQNTNSCETVLVEAQ